MLRRPRDTNQLAKMIVDIAAGEMNDTVSDSKRSRSKQQSNGTKGGNARAAKLSPSKRKAIAKKASRSRWKK
jgi:hypothetical protein